MQRSLPSSARPGGHCSPLGRRCSAASGMHLRSEVINYLTSRIWASAGLAGLWSENASEQGEMPLCRSYITNTRCDKPTWTSRCISRTPFSARMTSNGSCVCLFLLSYDASKHRHFPGLLRCGAIRCRCGNQHLAFASSLLLTASNLVRSASQESTSPSQLESSVTVAL